MSHDTMYQRNIAIPKSYNNWELTEAEHGWELISPDRRASINIRIVSTHNGTCLNLQLKTSSDKYGYKQLQTSEIVCDPTDKTEILNKLKSLMAKRDA